MAARRRRRLKDALVIGAFCLLAASFAMGSRKLNAGPEVLRTSTAGVRQVGLLGRGGGESGDVGGEAVAV